MLPLVPVLAWMTGCEEPRNPTAARPATAPAPAPVSAPSPAPAPAPAKDNFIVGQRTQDIRNAGPELNKGAVVGSTKITAKDPITLTGNAYVTSIGRISIDNIKHAMDLYQATNDRYPKDYDEFMNEIIKANNIALPQLPYYQKYGYDEKEHQLIILEYPDLKNQAPR
jgi:hypothetical protein